MNNIGNDVLNIIANFLDARSLTCFMICNKALLFLIGKSEKWFDFVDPKKRQLYSNMSSEYETICEALENNPILPNTIRIQPYYGDYYYYFRYHQLNFDGYLRLGNIVKCSKQNLLNFEFVMNNFEMSTGLYRNNLYQRMIRNFDLIKYIFRDVSKKILDLLILPPVININDSNKYNMIIDVQNYKHKNKIASKIYYTPDNPNYKFIIPWPSLYYVFEHENGYQNVYQYSDASIKIYCENKQTYPGEKITIKNLTQFDWAYLRSTKKVSLINSANASANFSNHIQNITKYLSDIRNEILNDRYGNINHIFTSEKAEFKSVKYYFDVISQRINVHSKQLFETVENIFSELSQIK
jgi:hypothetical protein